MKRRPVIALVCYVVLVAGCSRTVASIAPAPSKPSYPAAASAGTAAATMSATPTPRPPASPVPTQVATSVTVDTVAVTVADELRVRSKPRVSDDSYKYEPLLPAGTPLYVLDGPTSASGYTWFEVAPLSSRSLHRGWVASASRDGEPWIEPSAFECPPAPTDMRSLAALPSAVGLACFPRVPITVGARIVECNCDMDGGWHSPSWFFGSSGSPDLLVEPDRDRPPVDTGDWFILNLDPSGRYPDELPIGRYEGDTSWSKPGLVEVTGIFDHPAAAGCTSTEPDGQPVPTQDCRLAFAVTRLVSVGR